MGVMNGMHDKGGRWRVLGYGHSMQPKIDLRFNSVADLVRAHQESLKRK